MRRTLQVAVLSGFLLFCGLWTWQARSLPATDVGVATGGYTISGSQLRVVNGQAEMNGTICGASEPDVAFTVDLRATVAVTPAGAINGQGTIIVGYFDLGGCGYTGTVKIGGNVNSKLVITPVDGNRFSGQWVSHLAGAGAPAVGQYVFTGDLVVGSTN